MNQILNNVIQLLNTSNGNVSNLTVEGLINIFRNYLSKIGQISEQPKFPITNLSSTQWNLNMVFAKSAWQKGFNGKGITIMIIDGGVDNTHPDLKNLNTSISLSGNIQPYIPQLEESHGTCCASIAAGTGTRFVTGVAWNSTLGSVQAIGSGNLTPTSTALTYELSKVDIYSNSWGPTFSCPYFETSPEEVQAVITGTSNGRGGKGAIYVFAGGNENIRKSQTAYDNLLNLHQSIAVGSVNEVGEACDYSTRGAALLVSAPGGKDIGNEELRSFNSGIGCLAALPLNSNSFPYTQGFNGTSAACPHISGICALILQANSKLTWRDVQMILTLCALQTGIEQPNFKNQAGLFYDNNTGYGVPHAGIAVDLAKQWTLLPSMVTREVEKVYEPAQQISEGSSLDLFFEFPDLNGYKIECIIIYINATGNKPSDLSIDITAPGDSQSITILYAKQEACHEEQPIEYDSPIKVEAYRFVHLTNSAWTLKLQDKVAGNTTFLNRIKMQIFAFQTNTNYISLANQIRYENIQY